MAIKMRVIYLVVQVRYMYLLLSLLSVLVVVCAPADFAETHYFVELDAVNIGPQPYA